MTIFALFSSIYGVDAQQCELKFSGSPKDVKLFERYFDKKKCDTLELNTQLSRSLNQLYSQGYLLASYSIRPSSDTIPVFIGPKYKWTYLSSGNVREIILSKIGFREKFYANKPFKINELDNLLKKIIDYGEREGYPFISVKLDSISIKDNEISATLNMDQGVQITYDSIEIDSDFKIKKSWLSAYLNLQPGDLYDQRSVDNIISKLSRLKFLEVAEPPEVTFQNKQATIKLTLKRNDNNRVDGIIGFLPNEEREGSLLVTGQFDLALSNLFNSGKELNIQWQSLKARSQFLDFSYYHRNLFHSALHLSSSFQILKEDTLFINREGEIAFNFNPSQHGFEIFTKFRSSRLLSTAQFGEITALPDIIDFNLDYYGLAYSYNMNQPLDFQKKYFSAQIETSVGSKRIRRNNGIPAELYNNIDLRSVQYNLTSSFEFNLPLGRNFTIYQRIGAGKIFNENLFLNDLFRIGGLKTLRGYNENFFFASDYLLSNLELRLYFQNNSYLLAFYDQSYLYYDIEAASFEDYPLGIGVGLNIATKSGIVSIAYGVGKSEEQPLSLSLSKFHFGYVTKF